jgi:hypothetical protein
MNGSGEGKSMQKTAAAAAAAITLVIFVSSAIADGYTNGYVRKDGTYVRGYYHSDRDSNPYNNFSTRGNVNPYTGQPGTKDPYSSSYGSSYSNPYDQTAPKNPYDPN